MTEPSGESTETTDGMPFRLRDMELKVKVGDIHPIFERIDEIRKQWKFMFLLAKNDWKKENYLMLGFGIIAFILGAVSADIVSGGDSLVTGMEGITGLALFHSSRCCYQLSVGCFFTMFGLNFQLCESTQSP